LAEKRGMKIEALRQWQKLRRRRLLIIAAACVTILLAAIGVTIFLARPSTQRAAPSGRSATASIAISPTIRLNLPPPDLLRPITPEEALKENSERAFSGRPDTPAKAFKLKADAGTRERALECMTQAVYYEAITEGADGQRAVAQIVLNRMRHPAYPHSVCGVVYQGSDRPTGCQFTFTCDGSLARVPLQSLWKQAQQVASEALDGKVYGPVGHATHYHADYVLPYWADSLDKSVQVGRHIFYRLKGGLGATSAFRQAYAGVEPLPPPPSAIDVSLEAVQGADKPLTGPIEASPLQVTAGELIGGADSKPQLTADAIKGTLVLDAGAPPKSATGHRTDSPGCPKSEGRKPLRPLRANDVQAQSKPTDC
jgi:spore germination cell wall hydrolase CwlJ-like protein